VNEAALDAINGLAGRWDALDAVGRFGASDLLYVLAASLAFIWVVELRRDRGRALTIAVYAGLAVGAALALSLTIGHLFPEDRPWIADPSTHQLIAHSADASFPSDHTSVAFAAAVVALIAWPRWGWVAIVMAVGVALARVFVGVHYPGDVLAGAALGAACAIGAWFVVTQARDLIETRVASSA
jgi:undecaprenyl-diphosphatase